MPMSSALHLPTRVARGSAPPAVLDDAQVPEPPEPPHTAINDWYSLDDALQLAEDIAVIDAVEELMVIGGAQIYAEALPRADRLYYTAVHGTVDGDAFLPAIDWTQWRELSRETHSAVPPNAFDYTFLTYERCQEPPG